jgi:transposase InsO family protein
MVLSLVDDAVRAGARQAMACDLLGIDERSLQRWREKEVGDDMRAGPKSAPGNKLTPKERELILEVSNLPEHRDLSPKQIVPRLADQGRFIASESSFYRVLREERQIHHREQSRAAAHSRPRELAATAPNQVWSWDITYLPSPVKGVFFYLYLVLDVFSRKIVGWEVYQNESADNAREMIARTCSDESVQRDQVSLHQDNGAPMKCGTFLALLQTLGVAPSFSRPGVSDDNPFVESLFRTLKYRPEYPNRPFASLEAARAYVGRFVHWYNSQHLHGEIRFVTPAARHEGADVAILERRTAVYERARARRPDRWSRGVRDWSPIDRVVLNPRVAVAAEAVA